MTNQGNADVGKWEGTEAAAWNGVWEATPPAVIEALGMSHDEHPSLTIFRAANVPSWFFNRMLVRPGVELPRPLLDAEIDRFVASGLQFGACVPPATSAELPRWLNARGLVHTTTLARMITTTERLPSPAGGVEIRQVGREHAAAFGEIATRGFGMPPACPPWFARLPTREGWRAYLAYVGGEPVATGALYIHGTVGWLGFGSTLDEHRGHGIHRAMLLRRMADAADLGCRWLQTETNHAQGDEPTPSLDNMKRVGFQMAYTRDNYVLTPTATPVAR